jgi:hypothetical protein
MHKPKWAARASGGSTRKPSWAAKASSCASRSSSGSVLPKPCKRHRPWTRTTLHDKLLSAVVPQWWVSLVLDCAREAVSQPMLYGVEYFSGCEALSSAFRLLVGPFASFDIRKGDHHDILKANGLRTAIILLLSVMEGGYLHFGTPCKSWVALSRSFTRRSVLRPQGPSQTQTRPKQWSYLCQHNRIAVLTAYLCKTASAFGLKFTIEQPVSSLLFHFPEISAALIGAGSAAFVMGAFQGESPKPLVLKGTVVWLPTFRQVFLHCKKKQTAMPSTRLTKRDNKGRYTGKADALTSSSSYTTAFGLVIAMCHLQWSVQDICSELRIRGHL